MSHSFRIERDTMGEMQVPEAALYGAQTARAMENFPVSRLRFQRAFIRALELIKSAAASVNRDNGWVPREKADAIERAAEEVAKGLHDDQFAIDVRPVNTHSRSDRGRFRPDHRARKREWRA